MPFLLKTLVTALVVAAVSELARRYSLVAAALASLPLTSILAFIWLYNDTHDTAKISALSYDIFWLVIPSLGFFLLLPWLLQHGVKFYPALLVSSAAMAIGYAVFIAARRALA